MNNNNNNNTNSYVESIAQWFASQFDERPTLSLILVGVVVSGVIVISSLLATTINKKCAGYTEFDRREGHTYDKERNDGFVDSNIVNRFMYDDYTSMMNAKNEEMDKICMQMGECKSWVRSTIPVKNVNDDEDETESTSYTYSIDFYKLNETGTAEQGNINNCKKSGGCNYTSINVRPSD